MSISGRHRGEGIMMSFCRPLVVVAVVAITASASIAGGERQAGDPAGVLWHFQTGGWLAHTPTVVGELVIVGSCNGIVRALDLNSGRVRWENKVSPDPEQYFFHSDPIVGGDVIVVAADRATGANIHAFDVSTGKELWRHPAGRGVNGPLAGVNNRVYAANLEGKLLSLDIRSGALAWSVPFKVPGWEGAAVAGDRVFAGTVDGWLHALNAESGREHWRVNLDAPVTTTITAAAEDVYVGTANGSIHRVDAQRGAIGHSLKLDANLIPRSVPVRTATSLLVLLTDQGADFRALVAIDPALEHVTWRVAPTKTWSTSRVFVWGDVILLGTASGDVTAYCTDTGAAVWARTVKGSVRSIGGSGDVLLVGTRPGDLYAMRAPRSCDRK
jgi:outer membrane protein assembly factor BamB